MELDQTARVIGSPVDEALFDTAYFHDEVIEATLARDISLLCPAPPSEQGKVGGKFHKSQFDYHPDRDTYSSPVRNACSSNAKRWLNLCLLGCADNNA